jgi:uridine phosphorylase
VGSEVGLGDLVLPIEVIREEGTSFHYTADEENARPDRNLFEALRGYLERAGDVTLHTGKTVSTDAAFRQTVKKERRWRELGVLAVDMEMSAVLAAARHHEIPAVGLLVVSDKHDLEGDTPWEWGGEDMRASRLRAVDLIVDFARVA